MDIVPFYRTALVANIKYKVPVDWLKINTAIIERWSKSALERIKKAAWKSAP